MSAQILIADDDEITRAVMADVLRDRGHAVAQAGDGVDAMRLLREWRFDVAVLDYHMPLVDGATAASRTSRRAATAAGPRFIGVTADPDGLEMRGAGVIFDAIVQKPLHLPAFLRVVEASLADLRRITAEGAVLDAWRAVGFERRPRATFASEPGRDWEARLGRVFDLGHPANPDVLLVTEGARLDELGALRTDGNLFALPMVDVGGRWGRLADATLDPDDRPGWAETAAAAKGFAARRVQLAARFINAATLADKLLAYVFVSGRDLVPVGDGADEWTPAYPGFFPVRRARDVAEGLAHQGFLTREAEPDASPFDPPRFGITPLAVALLTGAETGR